MSDASAMVERCGRHQHPELFGGRAVDTACSSRTAAEILAMVSDRGAADVLARASGLIAAPYVESPVVEALRSIGAIRGVR